jgi:uncharacterized caspase-like protein
LLERVYIDVNGVPLHGASGINLRKQAVKTWEQEIEIELSAGKNKIAVSVLNEKGAESLKETLSIQCDAPAGKPTLYLVAVGVSDYQDERYRLTYADKDARDLADLLGSRRDRYADVKLLRLLNRDATRENILKARDFLKGSGVDDLVVLFFAGHGLLDSKLDYYFATADIDFTDPAKRGLSYESIEDLLDGIRARKKLLLMDTCHSGELDKEEVQADRTEKKPEGEIRTRTFRGGLTRVAPRVGLGNSYQLLQEMFADLRRGSGAMVIASAGGAEYALESESWKNGVFTHALLRGVKGEAARVGKGSVHVSELRDFVEQEVRRLTDGRQTPTSRRENIEVDFTLDGTVDAAQPVVTAPKPKPEPKPEPKTEDKPKLTRADIVGVWRHKPGNSRPGEMTLHANGKINNPRGNDTWTFDGTTLVLRWANKQAPGGFWIDTCNVSPNGKTYRGANQKGLVITGEKVKDLK